MEESKENAQLGKDIILDVKSVGQILESVINKICVDSSKELVSQFIESSVSTLWNQYMSDIRTMMETAVNDAPVTLHNGSSKKPYQVTVPFDVNGVTDFFIEGLDGTGLISAIAPDKKSFSITGIPKKVVK